MVLHEIAVRVPVIVIICAARVKLNEAHAAFHEPSRKQTAPAEFFGLLFVQAVHLPRIQIFLRQIDGIRRVLLHAISHLITRHPRAQFRIAFMAGFMLVIEILERIEKPPLHRIAHLLRPFQVEDRLACRAENDALITGRHISIRPIFRSADRPASWIEHDAKPGHVLVDAAQAVVDP